MRSAARRFAAFYWGDGIADDVPALTYYLVLSLAPLALGIAALEALLLDDYLSALDVVQELNRFLPESVHADVEQLVLGTREDSPALLALAVAVMLWTTSGAIGVLERCLSRILDCDRHAIVTGRLRNMLLGAGIAAVLIVATASAPVAGWAVDVLDLRGDLPGIGLLVEVAGSIVVIAAIYRYAPRKHMHWRSALLGAIPAGIGIQVIPTIVGAYVNAAAGLAATRIFLALAVILLGLYVMALALLVGAGLAARTELARVPRLGEIETAPRSRRHPSPPRPTANRRAEVEHGAADVPLRSTAPSSHDGVADPG